MRPVIAALLLFAAFALALGITLPLLTVQKLYFLNETPSLLGIIAVLWADGDVLLAALVAAFSLVFPLVKLYAAFIAAMAPDSAPAMERWLSPLSRWSLMDVLLVAIAIFAAKTSGFANAFSQAGLWFYAASTLAVAAAFSLTQRKH